MVEWIGNSIVKDGNDRLKIMEVENVKQARAFHSSFPQYEPTPLLSLDNLAAYLGIKNLYVKDESYRFGLNAFKVLGCSFAMARFIAAELGMNIRDVDYTFMTSEELKERFTATFFTATDGNHGRSVAWAANKLGQKAHVYVPKGTVQQRIDNIKREGAIVHVEDVNYDECVRIAAADASRTEHGVVVQDTAWDGYEDVPAWIMQGYGTLVSEAIEQITGSRAGESCESAPTHIIVQAGVGSFAGAVTGYIRNLFPQNHPKIIIVEAQAADCLYRSALAADGRIRYVDGDLNTIMSGLACGEPNTLSWDILRHQADFFVSCPDSVAETGMRVLAAPIKGDAQIVSGESGAVGMGLVTALFNGDINGLHYALGLNEHSRVLLFSTEGDTDPLNYRKIVWG